MTPNLVPANLLEDVRTLIEGARRRAAVAVNQEQIVVTLSQQLSWSQFLARLPLEDPLARDFYAKVKAEYGKKPEEV